MSTTFSSSPETKSQDSAAGEIGTRSGTNASRTTVHSDCGLEVEANPLNHRGDVGSWPVICMSVYRDGKHLDVKEGEAGKASK